MSAFVKTIDNAFYRVSEAFDLMFQKSVAFFHTLILARTLTFSLNWGIVHTKKRDQMSEHDRLKGKEEVTISSDEYISASLDQLTQDLNADYPEVIEGDILLPVGIHGNPSFTQIQEITQTEIDDLPPDNVIRLKFYRDQLVAAERAGVKRSDINEFKRNLRVA